LSWQKSERCQRFPSVPAIVPTRSLSLRVTYVAHETLRCSADVQIKFIAMNEPKRQHSVPGMLQRRFADTRGRLWFFDKQRAALGIRDTSPDNLFVHNRQYTLLNSDGTRDWSLETRYSSLEGYMNLLIEKVVPPVLAGNYPSLTANERGLIDLYVYEQWRRVPELYERLISHSDFIALVDESVAEYEQEHRRLTPVERARFESTAYLKAERQRARVMSLSRTTGTALAALSTKGLFFARTARNRSFLLGSFPVMKLTPVGQNDLNHPQVEVWLAIDPNVAVVLAADNSLNRNITLSAEGVRYINRIIAKQSGTFAGRDKALVASIAKSVA
jgi:hypothetical protein